MNLPLSGAVLRAHPRSTSHVAHQSGHQCARWLRQVNIRTLSIILNLVTPDRLKEGLSGMAPQVDDLAKRSVRQWFGDQHPVVLLIGARGASHRKRRWSRRRLLPADRDRPVAEL